MDSGCRPRPASNVPYGCSKSLRIWWVGHDTGKKPAYTGNPKTDPTYSWCDGVQPACNDENSAAQPKHPTEFVHRVPLEFHRRKCTCHRLGVSSFTSLAKGLAMPISMARRRTAGKGELPAGVDHQGAVYAAYVGGRRVQKLMLK